MFEKRFESLISRLDSEKAEQFRQLYKSVCHFERIELIALLENYFKTKKCI